MIVKEQSGNNKNQHSILDLSVSNLAYYTAFAIWLSASIVYSSFYASAIHGFPFKAIRYGCIALLLFGELAGKRINNSVVIAVAFLAVTFFAADRAETNTLKDAVFFIFCARDNDFRSIAKVALSVTSICIIAIVLSSYAGIIPDYVTVTSIRIRHYLGFRYALYPSQYLFLITCLVVYLTKYEFRLRHAAVLYLCNYFIYQMTDSRLSFGLSVILIASSLIVAKTKWRIVIDNGFGRVVACCFLIFAVFSVFITARYSPTNAFLVQLDQNGMLGGRLANGSNALRQLGVPLLGQRVELFGNGLDINGVKNTSGTYNWIDCMYIRCLVQYGLIFTVVLLVLMTAVCMKAVQTNDFFLLLCLVVIAAHCVIDDLALYLYYNTFLLLIGDLVSGNGSSQNLLKRMKRGGQ